MSRPGSTVLQEAGQPAQPTQPAEHLYDSIGPVQPYSAPTPTQGEFVRQPRSPSNNASHHARLQCVRLPVQPRAPEEVEPPVRLASRHHQPLHPRSGNRHSFPRLSGNNLTSDLTSTRYIFHLIYN